MVVAKIHHLMVELVGVARTVESPVDAFIDEHNPPPPDIPESGDSILAPLTADPGGAKIAQGMVQAVGNTLVNHRAELL